MEVVSTINADKRYYLDEGLMTNVPSFQKTMRIFTAAKISLYNALYDFEYNKSGPLTTIKYPTYLKETFGTNAYYNAMIYTAASGQLSSQKELRKLRIKTLQADIDNRNEKLVAVNANLQKKLAIKASIREYAKTGKWGKPYPRCKIKVQGDRVFLYNGDMVYLDVYELFFDESIRKLKARVALIKEACKRKQKKLKNTTELPPKRIIFGSKKLYSEKDLIHTEADLDSWKNRFHDKRYQSMSLSGRSDAKYCNFVCKFHDGSLFVTNIDGTVTEFKYFGLTRYEEAFAQKFNAQRNERQPICYNFDAKRDSDGRLYIIVSVTMKIETNENFDFSNGAVAMDINWDHFALAEIDASGNLLDTKVIHFDLLNNSTGQNTNILGRAVKEAFYWCEQKNKRLVVEDIDLVAKLAARKYKSRVGNHHMTLFAYNRILLSIQNQALKHGIGFRTINPAYTSQMGKFLFMKKYGISIHQAAAYAIGLVGLRLFDKLKPDDRLLAFVKDGDGNAINYSEDNYREVWRKISAAFANVPKHMFYRGVPYTVLQNKKRPSLKSLASEMKKVDAA